MMLSEVLLVLILVPWRSGQVLFYGWVLFHFKHWAVCVPLQPKLYEKEEKQKASGGGKTEPQPPQTLPVITSRVQGRLGSSSFLLMGLISGTWHHKGLMGTSVGGRAG